MQNLTGNQIKDGLIYVCVFEYVVWFNENKKFVSQHQIKSRIMSYQKNNKHNPHA